MADLNQSVEMIVKFYNLQNGTRYQFSSSKNAELVEKCLKVGDIPQLKAFIRNNKFNSIEECFETFIDYQESERVSTPSPTPAPAPALIPSAGVQAMDILTTVVAKTIAETQGKDIIKEIKGDVLEEFAKFMQENYGEVKKKVTLQVDDKPPVEFDEVLHTQFDTVLKFVNADEPVFLSGPAGSGKNVLCQQVAKALGLEFYFSNAVTQEYKITGFTDAMGIFHETQFYKAFKNGGLFMLDEMDASIPEVLIVLNSAIANRYFDFPAPIGKVEAHEDFRVISAGNTFGYGADYEYVGRNQLDMASLDRFALVKVDYDDRIALSMAGGNSELLRFCNEFRNSANRNGIKLVVSYRAIKRISKLEPLIGIVETLKSCLIKGLDKDSIRMIAGNINTNCKYNKGLEAIKNE